MMTDEEYLAFYDQSPEESAKLPSGEFVRLWNEAITYRKENGIVPILDESFKATKTSRKRKK